MPKMSNALYMKEAQLAVEYVKSKMTTGAANKAKDIFAGGPTGVINFLLTLGISRSTINILNLEDSFWNRMENGDDSVAKLWTMRRRSKETMGNEIDPGITASDATSYGTGNCGEQSAIAFTYLCQKNVFPIDWCHFDQKGKDHAFVIVNAKAPITPTNFSEWSNFAILCDPWDDRVDFARCLIQRWDCDKVASYCHLDGHKVTGFEGINFRK